MVCGFAPSASRLSANDNLGLEPVWKRYKTILVSDGGAVTPPSPTPRSSWLSQALRATDIALQQGINMRRRVLFGLERTGERRIVYWGIGEGESGAEFIGIETNSS